MVLTARRHRGIRLQPFMVRRSGALIGRCSRSERHSAKSATYGCAGSRSQALRASRLYRARTARRSTSRSPAATASEPPYPKFWPVLASFEPSEVGRGGAYIRCAELVAEPALATQHGEAKHELPVRVPAIRNLRASQNPLSLVRTAMQLRLLSCTHTAIMIL